MTKKEFKRRQDQETRLSALGLTTEEADTLRRCSCTLTRWGELECGGGNDHASWAIERDEATGKPYMVTYPHQGKTRRSAVADREKGALKRIKAICGKHGLYFHHQGDCRGVALYVSPEPLTNSDYTRGIAVW